MKKKSCRMTNEERNVHERAVRIRKMTDAKLVRHIDDIRLSAYEEGYSKAQAEMEAHNPAAPVIQMFIEELSTGVCRGVKSATVHKITKYARDKGYIV